MLAVTEQAATVIRANADRPDLPEGAGLRIASDTGAPEDLSVAAAEYRNRPFLRICLGLMIVQIVVAVAGWLLHVTAILDSPMQDRWERIVYSAPLFAPLLFADLALLACIGLATMYVQAGQQEPIVDAAASPA